MFLHILYMLIRDLGRIRHAATFVIRIDDLLRDLPRVSENISAREHKTYLFPEALEVFLRKLLAELVQNVADVRENLADCQQYSRKSRMAHTVFS